MTQNARSKESKTGTPTPGFIVIAADTIKAMNIVPIVGCVFVIVVFLQGIPQGVYER
jgi:hypothetical protein